MFFSKNLLLLRKRSGFSQEQLAERLAVSQQAIAAWENRQSLPDFSELVGISELFGVSIDQLLKQDLSATTENLSAETDVSSVIAAQDVLFCAKCGRKNRAGSTFCGYCGYPFPPVVSAAKEDLDKANLQMQWQALQLQQRELEEVRKQTEQKPRHAKTQAKEHGERRHRLRHVGHPLCSPILF